MQEKEYIFREAREQFRQNKDLVDPQLVAAKVRNSVVLF
jgi:hypothetical protein